MAFGTQVVLEISSGSDSVRLDVQYRWWTSDPDPWSARTAGVIGASSGTWLFKGGRKEVWFWATNPNTGKAGEVLVLEGAAFKPITSGNPFQKAGQSGSGRHMFSGALIPGPFGPVDWRVISIT
jgi:hypothetical protein